VSYLKEDAFEDWDVLMLFNAQMDGIEDSPIAAHMGFANLAAPDWFKPFRAAGGDDELHNVSADARQ